jgi:hypothetical protein
MLRFENFSSGSITNNVFFLLADRTGLIPLFLPIAGGIKGGKGFSLSYLKVLV